MVDKCEKHDEVMGRTFDEINLIKLKVEKIDTKMDGIVQFKDMVHDEIYGNGKHGLKTRIEVLAANISRQWVILGIVLTAIITSAAIAFWR